MNRRSLLGACIAAIAAPMRFARGGTKDRDRWVIYEAKRSQLSTHLHEWSVTLERATHGATLNVLLGGIPRTPHTIVLRHPDGRGLSFVNRFYETASFCVSVPIATTRPRDGTINMPLPNELGTIAMDLYEYAHPELIVYTYDSLAAYEKAWAESKTVTAANLYKLIGAQPT